MLRPQENHQLSQVLVTIPELRLNGLAKKILDIATPLEIRRRLWVTKRIIKALEKEPYESLPGLALQKSKSIHQLTEDLLELSTYVPSC